MQKDPKFHALILQGGALCHLLYKLPLAQFSMCLQVYAIEGSDMCLTGTAEVPLGGMLMDQIISEEQLPMRMVAFGHCFRAESGSAGMCL